MELGQNVLHKMVDQIRQQETPSGIHVNFTWKAQPKTWGGFTPKELLTLTDEIADFYRTPPEDRKKIFVHFGDHEPFIDEDGSQLLASAVHIPTWKQSSFDTSIKRCDILLNRSLELTAAEMGRTTEELISMQAPSYKYKILTDLAVITCQLEYPWEAAAWAFGEEFNHAGLSLKTKTLFRKDWAKIKYARYAEKFHNTKFLHDYVYDVAEITAHRQLLRFLERMAKRKNLPDRAELFRNVYQLSLQKRMPVIADDSRIITSVFIKTGYRPPS